MKTVTLINGRTVPKVQAKISVFDNSLLYAEGLFETFLAIDNRIIFEKEHLDRLFRGSKVTRLDIPVDRTTLSRWMKRCISLHPARVKALRMTITSGESARWTGKQGKPQVILSAAPHTMFDKPFRLYVSDLRVDEGSVFRQIKTISYAINAAALRQARQHKCDDALLINEAGHVAEVTSANIFWIEDGTIFTPPLDAGCLEGVTRKILMRQAPKVGLEIIEEHATLDRLMRSKEIFISSSLKLALPISSIAGTGRKGTFKVGDVTRRLAHHMYEHVGFDEPLPF